MAVPTLWPAPDVVAVERIIANEAALTLVIRCCRDGALCPCCNQPSTRVHSRYQRRLADLPWHGVPVRLQLQTRRFFCQNPACQQRIFTERLPALAAPYARRTIQLQEAFHWIALALGGRPGARLIQELGLSAQRDTLLRLIRKQPLPVIEPPRVLGVDDWAFRRGHNYGTILIDLERHQRVDLLPDRSAETLARWLREHPGVEIVSRDRSPLYAEGARQGAPHAMQVADRWHLLKNLVEAMEGLLLKEHRTVRQAICGATPPTRSPFTETPPESKQTSGHLEREKQHRRERRLARYQEVQHLFQQGYSIRDIGRLTGLSRKTVRRFVQSPEFPERAIRQPRPTKIEAFSAYLRRRWNEGCHNSTELLRELRERGYTGGLTQVRELLRPLRRGASAVPGSQAAPENQGDKRLVSAPPSTRSVLWWLLRPDEQLEEEARQLVAQLCASSPVVKTARELALWFFRMVRERRAEEFGDWIEAARDGPVTCLRSFALKLLSDRAAVVAALSQPWSNGQVEGQVNRLKLVKRQMYGRANFDLLRLRVLASV